MNYIWFNYEMPILEQLPDPFKEAAILLNPFIIMPIGWTDMKKKSEYEHVYPELEESIKLGKPKPWKEVMHETGIKSYEELAVALKTSISALKKEFAREDLAKLLNYNLSKELYYPREDKISEYLIPGILEVLSSSGANSFMYSDPILDQSGELRIKDATGLEMCELAPTEIVITDEGMDYAFLSVYDSFITLFLSKEKKIKEIINKNKWEAVICGPETYISWYFGKIEFGSND
ncbi:hypothetical protein BVG16_31850 [Paenibacillus selenitireducens]|uniref:DUF2711 domain-containing protein n=1 Tax=Paenibacillus selenitireducens TaxID=1324314 RepID=A0A1T2WYX5_9BACL|nr:DUF2711 family protein [Paenibacillus selenitireducens]OPA72827.1 hypothetical protein BVG16_31850 [Paenibacillus selenitireducens]